jgi:hypothetical protein
MYGRKYMGIVRSAFLIDERGKIAAAWYGVSPKDTVPGRSAALEAWRSASVGRRRGAGLARAGSARRRA